MYELTKLSTPGWSRKFKTEYEAVECLRDYVCDKCMVGGDVLNDDGSIWYTEPDIRGSSSISDYLDTSCGCEFMVEIYND